VIRALGKLVRLKPGAVLSRHDFHLPLSDLLLDLASSDMEDARALWYSQKACSLAHDFLNLATMAGHLLWHVSVAPLRTGTPDSISISMYAESYFVFARSACDVLTDIIHALCVDTRMKGQVPKGSFNDLLEWVEKNPTRVPENIRFVAGHRDWFEQLRGIRDKLVHFGYDMNVYTNAVAPSYALMDAGESTLHFLRKPRERFENAPRLAPLLPLLKRIARGMLTLSDQTAKASVHQKRSGSMMNVLNGVYVPALNHILSYEEPEGSADMTPQEVQKRRFTAWYLLEARDYLTSLVLGYPEGFWLRFAVRLAERFGSFPIYMSEPKCPPYRDGEELVRWQLGFVYNGRSYALMLKDAVHWKFESTEGSTSDAEILQRLKIDPDVAEAVLVANSASLQNPIPPERMFDGVILESDPIKAADAAFVWLTRQAVV
jgi:hypothetical protein